ncbi:MAG: hypothetical protein PHD48_06530 [Alphaproteobacteria bacterium]|nr:hypothetical protein [Alphaproteobacteria bacterium]
MTQEYSETDEMANLAALKKEMFGRAFKKGETHYNTGSGYGFEIGAVAASAYANLLQAQIALQNSGQHHAKK